MKLKIEQLFKQIHKVPQVPEVVRTLITQLNDPNTNFNDIAKNVEKEQVISLKVLKLVNSAHFGLPKKIGSIDEAVIMLGLKKLKTLVIASGIVSSIPAIPNFNIKEFWSDSFRTATYSKWLVDKIKLDNSDIAYTAGLINGLGIVLLYLSDAKTASKIDQQVEAGKNRPDQERKHLGFTSQEVCAELCRRWHFSEELINIVSQSENPLGFKKLSLPACAVFISKYISESYKSKMNNEEILLNFPSKEWQQLGLEINDITKILPKMIALESGLDGLLD
ncbi:MAG: HDOD domain-containing protein [Methylococcaceae bacterium]